MIKSTTNKIRYKIKLNKLSLANQQLFAERLKDEIELIFPDLAVLVISKNKFSKKNLLELECSLSDYSYSQQIELNHINNQIDLLALDLEQRLIEQISSARLSAA